MGFFLAFKFRCFQHVFLLILEAVGLQLGTRLTASTLATPNYGTNRSPELPKSRVEADRSILAYISLDLPVLAYISLD